MVFLVFMWVMIDEEGGDNGEDNLLYEDVRLAGPN